MQERASGLTPDGHPFKPSRLHYLGSSLVHRFNSLGDLSDVNQSVAVFEEALGLTADGHPDKPSSSSQFCKVGNSLLRRFERFGDLSDINKSILKQEQALGLTSSCGR